MEGFRVAVAVQTRFRDADPFGHINNAAYATYLEMARAEYYRVVLGLKDYRRVDFILGDLHIRYISPAEPGETLTVGARVSRLPNQGRKSFDMKYRIIEKGSGRLIAEAESIQVPFDYEAKKPREPSREFLESVRTFEGL